MANPRRAIIDLFHLKRVNEVIPNETLHDAIRKRLSLLQIAPTHLDVVSVGCLLESLAHYRLADVPATKVAIEFTRSVLPTLRGNTLARVIASCAALEEHSIALESVPLLKDALKSMNSEEVASLCHSLSKAQLRVREKWITIAEHVIRHIATIEGADLLKIVQAFASMRVDYTDFFLVVERHVCEQGSDYLTVAQLNDVIAAFRSLNHTVVNLMALSTDRSANGLQDSLDHLAAEGNRGTYTNNQKAFEAFLTNCEASLRDASVAEVRQILRQCEERQVFVIDVLQLCAQRLLQLRESDPQFSIAPAEAVGILHDTLLQVQKIQSHHIVQSKPRLVVPDTLQSMLDMLSLSCVEVATVDPSRALMTLATMISVSRVPQHNAFAQAVIQHYSTAHTIELMDPTLLLSFVRVMSAFRNEGGDAVLTKHCAMLVQGIGRLRPNKLPVVAQYLQDVPGTYPTVLPALFNAVAAVKSMRTLYRPNEMLLFLHAMLKSNVRQQSLLIEIITTLVQSHSSFTATELGEAMVAVAKLKYAELQFYGVMTAHILQHQMCTVTELCNILFAFSFVVRNVVKSVQEVIVRLRMCASEAKAREITIALFSFARLKVSGHEAVSKVLCEKGLSIVETFRAQEVASVLQSLHQLQVSDQPVFVERLVDKLARNRQFVRFDLFAQCLYSAASLNRSSVRPEVLNQFMDDFETTLSKEAMTPSLLHRSLQLLGVCRDDEAALLPTAPKWKEVLLSESNRLANEFQRAVPLVDIVCTLHDLGCEFTKETPVVAALNARALEVMESEESQRKLRNRHLFDLFSVAGSNTTAAASLRSPLHVPQQATGDVAVAPTATDETPLAERIRAFHAKSKTTKAKTQPKPAKSKNKRK